MIVVLKTKDTRVIYKRRLELQPSFVDKLKGDKVEKLLTKWKEDNISLLEMYEKCNDNGWTDCLISTKDDIKNMIIQNIASDIFLSEALESIKCDAEIFEFDPSQPADGAVPIYTKESLMRVLLRETKLRNRANMIFVLGYDLINKKLAGLPCDVAFEICEKVYTQFLNSDFDIASLPEYDCLANFIDDMDASYFEYLRGQF